MSNNDTAMQAAWRAQSTEIPAMSVSYVRHRTSELQRSFRIRNILEQGICALGLAWCAIVIVVAPHVWIKIGVALLLLGIAFSMWQWKRRTPAHNADPLESAQAGLVFYKRELERRRDFHRTLWGWYLLPMAPGTITIVAWNFLGDPNTKGSSTAWSVLAMLVAWIVGGVIYERFKAAQYQRELDALSLLETSGSPSAG